MSADTAEATTEAQVDAPPAVVDEPPDNPYEYDEADTESLEGAPAPVEEEGKTEPTEDAGEATEADASTEEPQGEDEDSAPAEDVDEAEDTPSGAEPAEDKPKASAPAVDAELLTIAQSMGIPVEMAKGYGSSVELKRAMAAMAGQRASGQQPAQEQPPQQPAVKPEAKAPAFKIPEFTEEEHGEVAVQMADTMKAMQTYYEQREQANSQQLNGVLKHLDGLSQMAAQERFDMHVAALGDAYHDELGEGSTNALQTDSAQFGKRNELWTEMAMRRDGFLQRGLPAPSESALFEHARKIVFGDKEAAIARKTVENKVKGRRKQTISKPAGRKPKPVSGEEKFAADVDAHIAKQMDIQTNEEIF
jgi:hypothetical protein